MIPAFRRGCERQAGILKRMDRMNDLEIRYRQALIEAMQADSDVTVARSAAPAFTWLGIEDMPTGDEV